MRRVWRWRAGIIGGGEAATVGAGPASVWGAAARMQAPTPPAGWRGLRRREPLRLGPAKGEAGGTNGVGGNTYCTQRVCAGVCLVVYTLSWSEIL